MRNNPFLKVAFTLCFAFVSCEREMRLDDNAQYYETRGVIRGISPDRTILEIQHENIPEFMPSMTMPFSARSQKEIIDLRIGDAVSFRMTVTKKDFWVDRVKRIRREDVDVPDPKPKETISESQSARLREGDEIPFFSLTDQNGKQITNGTFRGQPFVVTFIFTRCPVPNFCPRMTNNFLELQNALKTGGRMLPKAHLLSITLDPAFDTPEILKQYGEHQKADPGIWSFATGDAKEIDALTQEFSVYRQTEGGTISHGLATALIDRDGKIDRIWRGNGWKPEEVIGEIKNLE
jgi:protein SCO1/2